MNLFLVFLVASIGGVLAKKFKIPSGFLIGSLVFSAFCNIFLLNYNFPVSLKFFSKILAGAVIGMRIERKDVENFKKMLKPLVFLMFGMFSYTLILAFLIYKFTNIDLITALFACTPGGLADMVLIAEVYGANVPQVTLIQTVRLISIICIFPPLCTKIIRKNQENLHENHETSTEITKKQYEITKTEIFPMFLLATFGAFLGHITNIPAGDMLGSMFATILFRFSGKKGYLPQFLKNFLLISVGVMIGENITKDSVLDLVEIIDIALISVFFVINFGFLMGFLLHKLCKIDLVTAILGSAPGGVQEMVIIADDLNAKLSDVATMQVFRVILVLTVFPFLIQMLVKIVA